MKGQVKGDKELRKTLKRTQALAAKEIGKQIDIAALAIKSTAVRKIQQDPASGEVYEKYQSRRRTHKASAPGQPPATDTGRLTSSIEITRRGLDAYVFTEEDYGRYLELGTMTIKPRPWLRPSLKENEDKIPRQLGKAVMRGARKAKPKS